MSDIVHDHQILLGLSSLLMSGMLGLNAAFVRSLVIKINKIDTLENKMDVLEEQFQTLATTVQDVGKLKERIAVLEFASSIGAQFRLPENK